MSSERRKRPERLEQMLRELRNMSDHDVLYSQAFAERLGLSLTDFKCSSIIDQMGPMTAGRLAELTGLTTGAITGVLDRLEKARLARRSKDPQDRRQVIIEALPEREHEFHEAVEPFLRELETELADYSDKDLELITSFVGRLGKLLHRQTVRLRAEAQGPAATEQQLSAPLHGVEVGHLRFVSAAARIHLRGGDTGQDLYQAWFEGRPPEVRASGGQVTMKYTRFSLFDFRKASAKVILNEKVPWEVEFSGGASRLEADLSGLSLQRLEVSGGASNIQVQLPAPRGTVQVRVSGGASQIQLIRPEGAAARVSVSGGLSKLRLDSQQLGAVGGTTRLESPDFRGASDRYEIEVSGGASHLTVESR